MGDMPRTVGFFGTAGKGRFGMWEKGSTTLGLSLFRPLSFCRDLHKLNN